MVIAFQKNLENITSHNISIVTVLSSPALFQDLTSRPAHFEDLQPTSKTAALVRWMRTHSLPAITLLVLLLLHSCSGVLADRTNLSMVRVVSPERVVYTISDEDAIRPLVDRLYIDNDREWRNHLVGNLKQLCGFAHVDKGRNGRNQAANWVRLEDVVWVRLNHAGEYVPLVGSVKHMYESVMEPRADYQNTKAALGELLPGTSGRQKKTQPDLMGSWEARRAILASCQAAQFSATVGGWIQPD